MAEAPKPLTDAERKTLEELQNRDAAVTASAAEEARKAKLASMALADALVKLVKTDKITKAVDDALADVGLDFGVKQQIQAFKVALDYNIGQVQTAIVQLGTPAPGEA